VGRGGGVVIFDGGYDVTRLAWLLADPGTWSASGVALGEVDRAGQACLRRFDREKSKRQCCHRRGWLAAIPFAVHEGGLIL